MKIHLYYIYLSSEVSCFLMIFLLISFHHDQGLEWFGWVNRVSFRAQSKISPDLTYGACFVNTWQVSF